MLRNSSSGRSFSKKYFIFLVIFLACMSAFGPFVTDMYLPTLPSMTEAFHTTVPMVQLGLSTAMIGLALGQVFMGPLSDKYGRRPILIISMAIFSVSALACIFSPSIFFFLSCRFFQGIGGAGGLVMSRSISADYYSGRELVKMMAIIGAVNGIAPVTAPVIGGLVSESVGWRGIFVILLAIGLALLAMSFIFRETLVDSKKSKGSIFSTYNGFITILKIKKFRFATAAFASAYGILFGYIASSPFLMQQHYGFSELGFSIIFAVNALAIGIGASSAIKIKEPRKGLMFGALLMPILALTELFCAIWADTFFFYEAVLFLMLVCVGIIFSIGSSMAMDAGREKSGAASAIVGALGFVIGGIVSPIVGSGNILFTTCVIFIISSLAVTFFAWQTYKAYNPE